MKIITLHQPWASLVALGFKRYETRSWKTDYRGPLLIHAAKRPFVSTDGSKVLNRTYHKVWMDALRLAYEDGLIDDKSRLPFAHQLPLGSIVAVANLSNCLEMMEDFSGHGLIRIGDQSELEQAVGDWNRGYYALQLDDVHPLEPIPFTSRQGKLLDVPEEILKQVGKAA